LTEDLVRLTAWADTVTLWLRQDSATLAADSTLLRLLPEFSRRIRQVEGSVVSAKLDTAEMRRYGIWVSNAEGLVSLEPHSSSLLVSYGRFVTPAMRQYLAMRSLEQVARSALDGAIAIPLDELAMRLIEADRLLAEYPDAVARVQVLRQFHHYLAIYLGGLPNTPAFDSSGQLSPLFRQQHHDYIAQYGGSVSGRAVEEYLQLMREHQFKYGAHVTEFLRTKAAIHP
jgi:hypothetical protein